MYSFCARERRKKRTDEKINRLHNINALRISSEKEQKERRKTSDNNKSNRHYGSFLKINTSPFFSFSYARIEAKKEGGGVVFSAAATSSSSIHLYISLASLFFSLSVCYSFLSNHQEKRLQSVVAFPSLFH